MVTDEQPVEELPAEECWALLGGGRLGRLAFRLVDELHVVPLNYELVDRRLLIRTTGGSKLLAAALGSQVALEVDDSDDHEAWSVVVHGTLRILGEDEERQVEPMLHDPWIATLAYDVVEVRATALTGRRFLLSSPRT